MSIKVHDMYMLYPYSTYNSEGFGDIGKTIFVRKISIKDVVEKSYSTFAYPALAINHASLENLKDFIKHGDINIYQEMNVKYIPQVERVLGWVNIQEILEHLNKS